MLTGQKTTLHRRGQTTVAAWVAMMVMVAEHLDHDKIAIPPSDRRWLFSNRRAPPHWRVWIGLHRRESHPLFTHNVLPFATKEEVERAPSGTAADANTQTSTICLGEHVVIHVMSSLVAKSIIRRWRLPPDIEPQMRQIWPVRISCVIWPPPAALTDAGLDLLAQQFFRAADALSRKKDGARVAADQRTPEALALPAFPFPLRNGHRESPPYP
jgi:hypothetical protein